MKLGSMIKRFAVPGGISVARFPAPSATWSKGRPTREDPVVETGVVATVVPLTGDELQRLAEGDRSRQPLSVYTMVELRTVDASTARRADQVVYNGETFEVARVSDWTQANGGFYHSIILRAQT